MPANAVALPKENWRRRYPGLARFAANRIAVAAAIGIVLLFLIAAFGPIIHGVDPAAIDRELIGTPQPPGGSHLLGTDPQGRDLLARLLAGARISLAVGVVSCLINLFIGIGVGTIAGYAHHSNSRWVRMIDTILMRKVDILYSIPLLLVVILLQVFVKPLLEGLVGGRQNVPLLLSPDLVSIYLALGLTNWLTMARLTRGEVINQARMDYVLAARSLGQRNRLILFRHILPNCTGPLAVAATLAIPEAIFIESFLAYIGLGVSAPQASWGTMASDAIGYMYSSPWQLIFPAIAISVTMLAFNLFGDGLRDAVDPSSR